MSHLFFVIILLQMKW